MYNKPINILLVIFGMFYFVIGLVFINYLVNNFESIGTDGAVWFVFGSFTFMLLGAFSMLSGIEK